MNEKSATPAQVLIVDDNEDAAMSLSMLLELEDIVAASVPHAEAALAYVQDATPPLLLIDIGLPGMDGFELAQRLRAMPGVMNSTLIALTGREIGEDALKDTAFDQCWTKPFDPRHLLGEVQRLLSQRSAQSS